MNDHVAIRLTHEELQAALVAARVPPPLGIPMLEDEGALDIGDRVIASGPTTLMDGDVAIELRVVGEIDAPHSSLSELLEHLVRADPRGQRGGLPFRG